MVAPVGLPNVSVVAAAAGDHVGVPPHVVAAAGVAATWTPEGSASVKVTPVRGAVVVGLFNVKVSVDVPDKLSREEKQLLKQLQEAQKDSPRKRLGVA
jgi:DnaJ-class molecular chaperone